MKRRPQFPSEVSQELAQNAGDHGQKAGQSGVVTPVEGFENHHPEIIDGLNPPRVTHSYNEDDGISTGTRAVGHDKLPFKFIIKEPQTKENNPLLTDDLFEKHPHFADPSFTTSHREGAYAKLAHNVFGLGKYVPPTTLFGYNGKPHSAQMMVPDANLLAEHIMDKRDENEHDPDWAPEKELNRMAPLADRQKMAIMNTIMGNHDRHGGNVLTNKQGLHLIDHGAAFDYSHKPFFGKMSIPAYLPARQWQDNALEPGVAGWVHSLDPQKLFNLAKESKMPEELAKVARDRLIQAQKKLKISPNSTVDKLHEEMLVHNLDRSGKKQIKM